MVVLHRRTADNRQSDALAWLLGCKNTVSMSFIVPVSPLYPRQTAFQTCVHESQFCVLCVWNFTSIASCASQSTNGRNIHSIGCGYWGGVIRCWNQRFLKCHNWPQSLLSDTEDGPPISGGRKPLKGGFLEMESALLSLQRVCKRENEPIGRESFSRIDLI